MKGKIESIKIKGFQAHEDLRIELDPTITTIVGPSDVGKSSVLRALRWVCLNKPQGASFLRRGCPKVSVSIEFDDGRVLVRERSKSGRNLYRLDGEEFAAFGTEVPEPISDALRLSEINFQDQHDPPFWISLSAGEVSRRLNEIVDLEVVDAALAEASRRVRKCKQKVDICKENLQKAKNQEKDLRWVVEAEQDVSLLETLDRVCTKIRNRAVSLYDSINRYKDGKSRLELLDEMLGDVAGVVALCEEAIEVSSECDDLESLVVGIAKAKGVVDRGKPDTSKLDSCVREMETLIRRSSRLASLVAKIKSAYDSIASGCPDTSSLDVAVSQFVELKKRHSKLSGLVRSIINYEGALAELKEEFDRLSDRLKREVGNKCPLCGQELKEGLDDC